MFFITFLLHMRCIFAYFHLMMFYLIPPSMTTKVSAQFTFSVLLLIFLFFWTFFFISYSVIFMIAPSKTLYHRLLSMSTAILKVPCLGLYYVKFIIHPIVGDDNSMKLIFIKITLLLPRFPNNGTLETSLASIVNNENV